MVPFPTVGHHESVPISRVGSWNFFQLHTIVIAQTHWARQFLWRDSGLSRPGNSQILSKCGRTTCIVVKTGRSANKERGRWCSKVTKFSYFISYLLTILQRVKPKFGWMPGATGPFVVVRELFRAGRCSIAGGGGSFLPKILGRGWQTGYLFDLSSSWRTIYVSDLLHYH